MCGRYVVHKPREVAQTFRLDVPEPMLFAPRWNVAPSQRAPVVRAVAGGGRELTMMRWGLVPSWADDLAIGNRMINARGETVQTKPSFRKLFVSHRCLVPATGFYEWKKVEARKQPYLFTLPASPVFALAGLWDRWVSPAGEAVETYTILTTRPNDIAAPIHDRMPLLVSPTDYDAWLNAATPPEHVTDLIRPFNAEPMVATAVSPLVNSPTNDRPECIEPLDALLN